MIDRMMQESPAGAVNNVVALPHTQTGVLAGVRRDCRSLHQSVATLQRCLEGLGDLIRNLDDGPEAERLRAHVMELDELLLLRIRQLSVTERLLEDLIRRG
jgi:ADP-ribose pyrophosphatase YjhB (NUDIX family)